MANGRRWTINSIYEGGLKILIVLDKYFAAELQQRGFNLDYKKMVEIYKASRQHPGYIARKKEEEELMAKMADLLKD